MTEPNCQNVPNGGLGDICLPSTTRRYQYQGKNHYDQLLLHLQIQFIDNPTLDNEYVVFDIDSATFQRDFDLDLDPEEGLIKSVRISFEKEKNTLIAKLVTPAHTNAGVALRDAVVDALRPMKLEKALMSAAEVPHTHPQGVKQPDVGWVRRRYPRRTTVVVEIAVSESLARLRRDVDMWVDPARGNVNIALAMKINRRKPEIKLEKYEWDTIKQKPCRTQNILIQETDGQVRVSGSPLIIPFELLIGRAPSSPVETDIEIVEEALCEIASIVWTGQGFE
ncbi:hypothetical protein N7517_002370 [Penicillium concentricum]|uniref:Uncharacterized protein n=1 Tax=Penicillium concentricum TaxID=293559 RepID=A0A9W9VKQ5_9EURO|nr:uncharacterized protein N7517_002370 [Penicillium concentricum]KAJ5384459.1 hypothetical protein N7517_002370 [Penicillium concentricum]